MTSSDKPPGADAQDDLKIADEIYRDETDAQGPDAPVVGSTRRPPTKKYLTLVDQLRWRRVACDEAQRVRNPTTAIFQTINQLRTNTQWSMTATPMCNKALDIYGYLLMLTKNAPNDACLDPRQVLLPLDWHGDPHLGDGCDNFPSSEP